MQHLGPIAGIASHGPWLATAGYDNRVILWDALERRALALAHHDHLVNHCAFSHDGRWLVSASSDYTARVWSIPDLRLQAVLGGHGDDVDMAAFSPDDRFIATCALDRCVRIFSADGRCLHEMHGHTGNVLSLAWTHDGRHVISSSVDGSIRLWDAEHGSECRRTSLQVRSDSVEIGANGTAYAGDDLGRIALITGEQVRYIDAHRAGIKKLVLDEVHGLLMTLSYDRTLALWQRTMDAEGPGLSELSRTRLPESIWARAAAVMPDGRLAVGTFGTTYALFDPASGNWNLEGVHAGAAINAVLQHGRQVISVGDAGEVRINGELHARMGSLCNFLAASGTQLFTGGQLGQLLDAHSGRVLYEHHSPLNCGVTFERHGQPHLAVGTYTGEVLVWSLGDPGQPVLVKELAIYSNAVKGLSVANGLLFSVCASTDIAWHRLDDWHPVRRIDHAHDRIANACCAVGDAQFASVGRDRTLRLWGPATADAYPSPHRHSVKCLGVDDGHTRVLTGSYGGTLALFDLATRRWLGVSRPTHAGISSIAWDAASHHFLAASYDGRIYPVTP